MITRRKSGERSGGRVRLLAALLASVFLISALTLGASAAGVSFPEGSVPTEVYLDGELVLAGVRRKSSPILVSLAWIAFISKSPIRKYFFHSTTI